MPDDHASSADPPIAVGADAAVPTGEQTAALHHIRVLLPLPLPAALDYLAPEAETPVLPGSFVRVPLGVRNLVGVVWDGTGEELAVERLKPVAEVLAIPRLRPELRRFVERVAGYTIAQPGSVLRMAMSVTAALEAPRPRRVCAMSSAGLAAVADTAPAKPLTAARRRVLEALAEGPPLATADLARVAGCGPGVVR